MKPGSSRWIVPALAAAIAGVLAFLVASHIPRQAAGQELDRLLNVSFLSRELNLNEAQVRELRRLCTALERKLDDSCTRHCMARMRLGKAVVDEKSGMLCADAAVTEMCAAYEQSERATLAHVRSVRAMLNEGQRRQFDELMFDNLARPCGRPGCACMAKHPTAGSQSKIGDKHE